MYDDFFHFFFLAEVQKLKHSVPKGDKKRKKEVTEQIASMEAELTQRHEQELAQFNAVNGQVYLQRLFSVMDSQNLLNMFTLALKIKIVCL